MVVRAVRQKEQFEKVFMPALASEITGYEDERTLLLYLRVMRELAEGKEEYTEERVRRLAEVHVNALRDTANTYQYFNLLFEALLRICSKNILYRSRVIALLSENKSQIFKIIKGWLIDSANPVLMINTGRWYYWRKATTSLQLNALQTILTYLQGN